MDKPPRYQRTQESKGLTEAELYAPDLDEGVLDVEHYSVPVSGSGDAYMDEVLSNAKAALEESDELLPD